MLAVGRRRSSPRSGGRPWLEKPPLAIWLVALTRAGGGRGRRGRGAAPVGGRRGAAGAGRRRAGGPAVRAVRRPARRPGPGDDRLDRDARPARRGRHAPGLPRHLDPRRLRPPANRGRGGQTVGGPGGGWAFFAGLGLTALAKGIGFGAALVGWRSWPCLASGTATAGAPAVAPSGRAGSWPAVVGAGLAGPGGVATPVGACRLWALHVTDRLAATARRTSRGSPWWQYVPRPALVALPWTPLALVGAGRSLARAFGRGGRVGATACSGPGRSGRSRPALAGDGQERPLRDPCPAPLVRLGGPGPGPAGRRGCKPRGAGRPIASVARPGSASRARPGLRPGLRDARPPARPPGRRVGLLRGRRPADSGRASRSSCSTTSRLGPPPLRHPVRPGPARPGGPALLPRPPRPCAVRLRRAGDRRPARRPFAVIGRDRDLPGPPPPRPGRDRSLQGPRSAPIARTDSTA